MAKATLFNPTTGKRTAVDIGSDQEKSLFSQGYFLETSYNAATKESTYDDPRQQQKNRSISSLKGMLPKQDSELDVSKVSPGVVDTAGLQSNLKTFFDSTKNTTYSQVENATQNLLLQRDADNQAKQLENDKEMKNSALKLEDAYINNDLNKSAEDLFKRFKIEETMKELNGYKLELAALDEQYKMADIAIANKPINAAIIRGQQALKQQEYAAKASTIEAKSAIAGEYYDMAEKSVKFLYDSLVDANENQKDYYSKLYEWDRDDMIRLDDEDKENINAAIELAQKAEDRAIANKDKVAELFKDPVMAVAFQKSGADFTMDYPDILMEMLPHIVDENKRLELLETARKYSKDGSGDKPDNDLTKDVRELANQAISLEKSLIGMPQSDRDAEFAKLVNSLVEAHGVSYDTAKQMIIRDMQSLKGEPVTYQLPITETPQGNGSDLVDEGGSYTSDSPTQEERAEAGEEVEKKIDTYVKDIITGKRDAEKEARRKKTDEERKAQLESIDTLEEVDQARDSGKLTMDALITKYILLGLSKSEAMSRARK